MLRFYRIYVKCFKNNELYGDIHQITAFTDKIYPAEEEIEITWENLSEIYEKWGLALPFTYW